MCPDCSTNQPFSCLLFLLRPPYSLRHSNIEIRPFNNPTKLLSVQVKRRIMSLTLNQKLEITSAYCNSTGNHIQYPVITYNGEESEKEYVCVHARAQT